MHPCKSAFTAGCACLAISSLASTLTFKQSGVTKMTTTKQCESSAAQFPLVAVASNLLEAKIPSWEAQREAYNRMRDVSFPMVFLFILLSCICVVWLLRRRK